MATTPDHVSHPRFPLLALVMFALSFALMLYTNIQGRRQLARTMEVVQRQDPAVGEAQETITTFRSILEAQRQTIQQLEAVCLAGRGVRRLNVSQQEGHEMRTYAGPGVLPPRDQR